MFCLFVYNRVGPVGFCLLRQIMNRQLLLTGSLVTLRKGHFQLAKLPKRSAPRCHPPRAIKHGNTEHRRAAAHWSKTIILGAQNSSFKNSSPFRFPLHTEEFTPRARAGSPEGRVTNPNSSNTLMDAEGSDENHGRRGNGEWRVTGLRPCCWCICTISAIISTRNIDLLQAASGEPSVCHVENAAYSRAPNTEPIRISLFR